MSGNALRPYQQYLLEHARQDNFIIVLPTGAGKTLIAVHLMVEALKKHPSKVVIFLAPTVPLCQQQATVISTEGGKLLGGRPPRVLVSFNHRTTNWKGMSLQKTIVVATPQKFRNDVSDTLEGKLPWRRCSLLVIDECHHSMKSHPYSLIMTEYNMTQFKPKFLGLTASPAAHVSRSEVEGKIKQLCSKLCSKIISLAPKEGDGELYREMLRAVNIPEVTVVSAGGEDDPFSRVTLKLEEQMRLRLRKLFEGDRKFTTTTGETISRYSDLCDVIDWLSTGTGPEGGNDIFNIYLAAETASAFGSAALGNLLSVESTPELDEIREELGLLSKEDPPKLKSLWDLLKFECRKHPEIHRGIIFVETRQTARDLADRIKEHPDEDISRSFRPSIFLGHTNKKDANRMTMHQQKEIITQFARGEEINLLLATSVAEEGIDIASCNFVIRLTAQMTPIKMIQSRGRARFRDSSYYILCANQADRAFVDSALTGELEMHAALKRLSERSLDTYTCSTTWDEQDPTIAKGFENKQPSITERHPAFKEIDFKSVLNRWALERWGSPDNLVYTCQRAGGTQHKPLWRATLIVAGEKTFQGKDTATRKESEKWAAFLACCHYNAVQVKK